MKVGIKASILAAWWLLPKQLKEVSRSGWVFIVSTLLLSLFLSALLVALVIRMEGILDEMGIQRSSQMSEMPAARLIESFSQWQENKKGKEGEGALHGVRVWLDCSKASDSQCQQGVDMVEGVGAIRVGRQDNAQLDVQWEGEDWEVGSRKDSKYVLPAAVVLYSQAYRDSWQQVFRPNFVSLQEDVQNVDEHAQRFLSLWSLQIVLMGILIPSMLVAMSTSGVTLSTTMAEVEEGRYEPMASVLLSPWVLFVSKALAVGVLVGGVALGVALAFGLMVGPMPLVVALAFSLSMALIATSTCLWGFLLMPLQIFFGRFEYIRLLRALPNPAMIIPPVFIGLLVKGRILSTLGFASEHEREQVLPLVDWGVRHAIAMASGGMLYAAVSLGALLLVQQSPWGRRRLSIRSRRV